MRVMAIDPGEKIGWATCELCVRKGYGMGIAPTTMKHGITDLKSFALRIAKVFGDYDVVIMESWRLSAAHARELTGSTLPTVQFIGMLRLLSWQNPKVRFVEQSPATKRTGLKVVGQISKSWAEFVNEPGAHDDTHDHDAVVHLAYWYWRTYV